MSQLGFEAGARVGGGGKNGVTVTPRGVPGTAGTAGTGGTIGDTTCGGDTAGRNTLAEAGGGGLAGSKGICGAVTTGGDVATCCVVADVAAAGVAREPDSPSQSPRPTTSPAPTTAAGKTSGFFFGMPAAYGSLETGCAVVAPMAARSGDCWTMSPPGAYPGGGAYDGEARGGDWHGRTGGALNILAGVPGTAPMFCVGGTTPGTLPGASSGTGQLGRAVISRVRGTAATTGSSRVCTAFVNACGASSGTGVGGIAEGACIVDSTSAS